MTAFAIDIVVRASALLTAAAVIDLVLRRRASAATRHLLWTLAVVALLALPIASSGLPAWLVPIPIARHRSRRPSPPPSPLRKRRPRPAWPRVRCRPDRRLRRFQDGNPRRRPDARVRRAVAPVAAPRRAVRRLRGRRVAAARAPRGRAVRAPPVDARVARGDGSRVAASARRCVGVQLASRTGTAATDRPDVMPLTFGTLAPVVVLPASADEWTEDRRRAVLLHELAHIVRARLPDPAAHCVCVRALLAASRSVVRGAPSPRGARAGVRRPRHRGGRSRARLRGPSARDRARVPCGPRAGDRAGMARARELERRLLAILDDARNRASVGRGRRVGRCRCGDPRLRTDGRPPRGARPCRSATGAASHRPRPRRRNSPARGKSIRPTVPDRSSSRFAEAARRTAARCRWPSSNGWPARRCPRRRRCTSPSAASRGRSRSTARAATARARARSASNRARRLRRSWRSVASASRRQKTSSISRSRMSAPRTSMRCRPPATGRRRPYARPRRAARRRPRVPPRHERAGVPFRHDR